MKRHDWRIWTICRSHRLGAKFVAKDGDKRAGLYEFVVKLYLASSCRQSLAAEAGFRTTGWRWMCGYPPWQSYRPPRRQSQPELRTLLSCEFLPKLLVLRARVGMFLGGFQRRSIRKSPSLTTHSGTRESSHDTENLVQVGGWRPLAGPAGRGCQRRLRRLALAWFKWWLVRWLRLQRWLGQLGRLGFERRFVRLVGIQRRFQR